jgi:hypothetical protein
MIRSAEIGETGEDVVECYLNACKGCAVEVPDVTVHGIGADRWISCLHDSWMIVSDT